MKNIRCNKTEWIAFVFVGIALAASGQDNLPPSAPTGLTATVASCGQVNLSWNPSTDSGGSGLSAYVINRSDNVSTTIGAARTTFSDTMRVRSASVLSYTVTAKDTAGNNSPASNTVTASTPLCALAPGEAVVDSAYLEPLGRAMATYGPRTALLYMKYNFYNSTNDTWLAIRDTNTGQIYKFLLHAAPGYYQVETDYVLTSPTELWTLSNSASSVGGNVQVNQYRLNGSPPTSATLLSSKPLGGSISHGASLIRLQSGGLMAAWYDDDRFTGAVDLTTGFAFRSPTGSWSIKSPVSIPNSGGGTITNTQMLLAQHPADGSIWAFAKRDSFSDISALHFTEAGSDVILDWMNPDYITISADGDYGPEVEFPFLAASPDATRNALLLGYESSRSQVVYVDPLYGSANSIFLKQAQATIAQIAANGSKTFIPFPNYMERSSHFGLAVQPDGTIWLSYQPIKSVTLTWNEVFSSKYQNGVWSTPALTGFNYRDYNEATGARNPGLLVYRADQPEIAFMTPDQKVHLVPLSSSAAPPPVDSVLPTTSITSPGNGTSLSGIVLVSATAADNVGVARVDFLVDGLIKATAMAAPFAYSWDTGSASNGAHTLQSVVFDAAGNKGNSALVSVSVANALQDTTPPVVTITSPANGATVRRNATMTISATASDLVGVSRVEFYVNNTLIGTDTSAAYAASWRVPGKNNGSYSLKAVAYDAAGNMAASSITVTGK